VPGPAVKFQQDWSRFLSVCEDLVDPGTVEVSTEKQLLAGIKHLPQVEGVVEAYRFALAHVDDFERAAMTAYGDELPPPVTHAHLLFGHRNALTDFVGSFAKACDANAAVADGLARYRNDPTLPDPCLLAFSDQQYRLLYTAFVFGWVRGEAHPDLGQIFRLKGLEYLGKIACASGDPEAESSDESPPKVWLEIRKRGPLADLCSAAASANKASLAEDVIQYLSIVHAAAEALALDSASATDNNLAKHALAVIGDLIAALT
jgi:hypothetical protein